MTEIDEDRLAEAYDDALSKEKAGDLAAAAKAYRRLLTLDPADRGGASVRLAALGQGAVPDKAPDAYVELLFDQHADVFDSVLVDQLGYSVPLQVRDNLLKQELGPFAHMLDLGCGTGLSGEALDDMVDHSTGVDLSERMIEIADEKGIYEALFVAEAAAFLKHAEAEWDLIVATDVLPYLGGAETLFTGVFRHLARGGVFVFSSESLPPAIMGGRQYTVGQKHRFAHDPEYLRAELISAGFTVDAVEDIIVRYEEGDPVTGHLILCRRPA